VIPSSPPPLPTVPGAQAARRSISPRKVILSVVLAGSVLFFFLILFAALVAILREAAPPGHRNFAAHLVAVKHIIAQHIYHFIQPRHK
jgi:hypothetical protein